jgi:uncharacterized protein (TIGR02001 family)
MAASEGANVSTPPSILLLVAAGALLAGRAWAQDDAPMGVSAGVTGTTDYVWRGYSQSDEHPALQGFLEGAHRSGLYLGVWGSNVDFEDPGGDDASLELDLYAGYRRTLGGGLNLDLGWVRYVYPDTDDLDFNEYYATASYGASYGLGDVSLGLGLHFSNEFLATAGDGYHVPLSARYTLPGSAGVMQGLSVGGGLEYNAFDDEVYGDGLPDSYWAWNLGLSKSVMDFDLDLRFHASDEDGKTLNGRDLSDGRFVFSISRGI